MRSRDLIQLAPEDNVLVAVRSLESGTPLTIGGNSVALAKSVGLGHKLAARAILPGEKIIKYGAPIGSATTAIAAGDHIHLHNMRSDYLPTYQRGEGANP